MSILGSIETRGFQNTNDTGVGVVILLIKENIPKINPTAIPTIGPSTMAPIITGICIMVAFVGPTGMNPSGVIPRITDIAPSIPVTAMCLTEKVFFLTSTNLYTSVPAPNGCRTIKIS